MWCLSWASAMIGETGVVELTVRYGGHGILGEVWGGREGGGGYIGIYVMGESII